MNKKRVMFLGALALVACAVLMAGAGVGTGVAQEAYLVGDISVSPSAGACVGGAVTFSGAGMPAGMEVAVAIGMDKDGDGYTALIGTTTADGAGNWSISTLVPASVTRDSDGASVATPAGTYDVVALSEDEASTALGTLIVLDCSSGKLPSTGFPIAAAGLLGAGLVASAGFGIRMMRRRR